MKNKTLPKYINPPPPPDYVDDTMFLNKMDNEIMKGLELAGFTKVVDEVQKEFLPKYYKAMDKKNELNLLNKSTTNNPVELHEFNDCLMKQMVDDHSKLLGTYSIMLRHPDTGELYMTSKVAINHENRNIIISQH